MLAADEEARIRAGTWVNPQAGAITLGDYFENQWLPNKLGELNTVDFYEAQYRGGRVCPGLREKWGGVQLRRILPSGVQGWVTGMTRDGVSRRTVEARFRALQTILAGQRGVSALRDRLISANPCGGGPAPQARGRGGDLRAG